MAIEGVRKKQPEQAKQQAKRAELADPIPNWRSSISSPFGRRHNPTGSGSEFHDGVDIAKPTGTPIHAAKSGTVVFAGAAGGYGNLVVIQHADGTFTKYAHQSKLDVQKGQEVQADDVIGQVGSTGRSTGPHLHFEVRRGNWQSGQLLDPVAYLDGATTMAADEPVSTGMAPDANGATPSPRPSGMALPGGSRSGASGGRRGRSGASSGSGRGSAAGGSRVSGGGGSSSSGGPSREATVPKARPGGGHPGAARERELIDLIKADSDLMAAFANWADLTLEEKIALAHKVSALIGKALGFTPEDTIFRDGKLIKPGESGVVGLFDTKKGLSLSDAALADPKQFLNTLVHEQAHKFQTENGIDMEADHAFNYRLGDEVEAGVFGT